MNVTMNVGKVGAVHNGNDVARRVQREIMATVGSMRSCDEGEKSFLLGKLTALLMVRDDIGDLTAYEKALEVWFRERKGQP